MNRRTFLRAAGVTAVALAVPGVTTLAQSANTCVLMEERDGAFVLQGSGPLLTEPFAMSAGRYRIEVALSNPGRFEAGFWVDFIHRESGDVDDFFVYHIDDDIPEVVSGSVNFQADGEYLAETDHFSGDWKIVLSPI